MKKILMAIVSSGLLVFGGVGTIWATPMIITFSGQITAIYDGDGDAQGAVIGDTVTATYLIDKELPGYNIDHGTINYYVDSLQDDYYYAEFVSGDYFGPDPDSPLSYGAYWGWDATYSPTNMHQTITTDPLIGIGNEYTRLSRASYQDWWNPASGDFGISLGDVFGYEANDAWDTNLSAYVTIVDIVYPPPIPEPSTIALLTCGLLGLLGICIKRRRKAK